MNIGIVGLGAIGSLWAVKLHQAGHQVCVFTRNTHQQIVQVTLDMDSNNDSIYTFPANQHDSLTQCECLLVTVKSTQVTQAILPFLPFLPTTTSIIFIHNGMGAVDNLQSQLANFPVYLATTTQAAFRPKPNHVQHTGLGGTLIGPYSSNIIKPNIIKVLNNALPPVHWQENIQTALWNKLAINCVINPLTAIHQCKNGELAQPTFTTTLNLLIQEIVQVMNAVSITISTSQLTKIINNVITATTDNYSSMQQDVAHQRITEIDYITGYLIRTAKLYTIEVPMNEQLSSQIKQLEAQYSTQ